MTRPRPPRFERFEIKNEFRTTLALVVVTLFLLGVVLLVSVRFGELRGSEIGVLLNRLGGEVRVVDQAGTIVYNGLTTEFTVLDRTVQTVEMSQAGENLRVKTVDGSNIELDLTVTYQIDEGRVPVVIANSGAGDLYKEKWVRDYARSICRYAFGELTTEGFYDAAERTKKSVEALARMNERLEPVGIRVLSVIPKNFRFDPLYEAKIKEKKLADQEVEEQGAKARAARQEMERKRMEADKKKAAALKTFEGQMKEMTVAAEAEAERLRQEADGYAVRTRLGAQASYYEMERSAEGDLARARAEAQGLAAMSAALRGEGGRNLLRLGYAEKLRAMTVTGQPFRIDPTTQRFAVASEDSEAGDDEDAAEDAADLRPATPPPPVIGAGSAARRRGGAASPAAAPPAAAPSTVDGEVAR